MKDNKEMSLEEYKELCLTGTHPGILYTSFQKIHKPNVPPILSSIGMAGYVSQNFSSLF